MGYLRLYPNLLRFRDAVRIGRRYGLRNERETTAGYSRDNINNARGEPTMFATSPMHLQSMSGTAGHQFQRARFRAWFSQVCAVVTHRSRKLLDLSAEKSKVKVTEQHYAGIHAVPIRQIHGSENRTADFDRDFNPLSDLIRQRWTNLFNAWQKHAAMPPVDLIQIGDTYFVRDGHHRISVAHALGQEYIEAVVTLWKVAC